MRTGPSLLPALLLVAVLLPGCVYTDIRTPLDTDLHATTLGTKTGEAHFTSILGLFAWGDAGAAAAARDGGITTLHHMDRQIYAILWFVYYQQTTIVYGD